MIRRIVDFALNNRFLVLGGAILLFGWGIVSFHNLPVEAYPDVANNYVNIITQWPGHSAEDIEQQVTVPTEIQMAGIPHLEHLRSTTLAGLSSIMLIFDDSSDNNWNRERVVERMGMVSLPAGLVPQLGTDWSPVGQIYFYTLESKNPEIDVMEIKSIEDWTLEKQFKQVPGVVDVSSLGGETKEYQIRLDPDKLVSYGLNIAQVEQQLANNNTNAGGSFIVAGAQQINVQAVGLVSRVQDIENTVIKTQAGTALRVRILPLSSKVRKSGWDRTAGRFAAWTENSSITRTWSKASSCCRKGDDSDPVLRGIEAKVRELNDRILPKGVKVVPFLDRSDLIHYTTHTVLHNLTEGIVLVVIVLFLFLGNARGALIVALTIPFSLLFASICLDLQHIPANLLSLGALDFGMVVDGAVVMVENIVRHLNRNGHGTQTPMQNESAKLRMKCSGPSSTPSALSSPPICPSLRCRRLKDASSSPWRGLWRLRCLAR